MKVNLKRHQLESVDEIHKS